MIDGLRKYDCVKESLKSNNILLSDKLYIFELCKLMHNKLVVDIKFFPEWLEC